jgi:tRNA A-37 threonylcarbamoyl transferase component Bud32
VTGSGGRRDGDLMQDRVVAAVGDLYDIEGEIGRGGMAIVYGARDVRLRRRVAVKVLPPELAYRADVKSRFLREAQMSAQLSHPNIVPIFSVDERDGIVFFVMGLVEGETLAQQFARDARPPVEQIRRTLREVADALGFAHSHGVVHRDVKPDNILIDRDSGRAMVTDFGIARAAEGDSRLTVTGVAVGTPAYMSPEQALGEREVDGRSDIYSLGVVAYQALAGELPFKATNTPAMMMKHLSETPPPLMGRRGDLPRAFVYAVERAMAKKPEDRWATAAAFRDALASDAPGGPVGVAATAPPPVRQQMPLAELGNPVRDPVRFGVNVGLTVAEQVVAAMRVGVAARGPDVAPPFAPAARGGMAPFPRYEGNSPDERRRWKDAQREWRDQMRLRIKTADEGQFVPGPDGRPTFQQRPLEERIDVFRRKFFSSIAFLVFLGFVNVATARFPWVIFPAMAVLSSLMGRWGRLRREGVEFSDVFLGRTPAEREGRVPGPVTSMDGLAARVARFRRRLKQAAGSAAIAVASFAVGSTFGIDPLAIPFFLGLAGTIGFGVAAIQNAFDLKRLGLPLSAALSGTWRETLHVDSPDLAARLMAGDLDRAVPADVKAGPYGAIVQAAAADRATIFDIHAKLGEADRQMLPDILPTVRGLEERITGLAQALHRMEGDVSDDAVAALGRRIATLEATPPDAAGKPERERTLALLQRQKKTLADLTERRNTLIAQLDGAALLLQTMKLDLLRLRSAGVQDALNDVTNATQKARALSKEIGTVLDVAAEVRSL